MISKKSAVFVIIPAFCEEKTIKKVVRAVVSKIPNVIVIDDGSCDDTGKLAKQAGAFVIKHKARQGYEIALSDGFKRADKLGAKIFITFDADGQCKPGELYKFLQPILLGKADIVTGVRKKKAHFGDKIFAVYTKIFYGFLDPLCGMKAYTKEVYKAIGHFDTIGGTGTQLLLEAADLGFKVKQVEIVIEGRKDNSRFYAKRISANFHIMRSLFKTVAKKLKK